jgi:magnesium-transporting ATPase (P-type)
MAHRLDPRPLLIGVLQGVRHRDEDEANERPDWGTRVSLIGLPIIVFIVLLVMNKDLDILDQLLGGTALLIGALLTAFSQVVAWRERVIAREEKSRTRALTEAAALILASVIVAIIVTTLVIVMSIIPEPCGDQILHWVRVSFGAAAIALLALIGLVLYIVTSLLWDAFVFEEQIDEVGRLGEL